MTDYLATAWNIRLCRPMTVDDAVELKETDPFDKTGDYWCHKDCYNSNPRRGIGVFPSRAHPRKIKSGVTINVRGCFKHRKHSSNVCGVREKSRRKGEDSGKSRMFFTQFAGDLRDYLNGDIQFTSELNQYEVREFFEIESISEPRPENEPDFTIQHSGVNPEREETHIVIINQNRSRVRFFQEGRFHQLNTIIIRVTHWQQAEIEDFNGYGARSFHDAWNQLLGRITTAREEREKEEERLAEDYSKLLSRHLGISTEGMTNKEIIDLFGSKSLEIEKIVDKIRKDEEKRLANIADKEKEDELARKRAEKNKERKRRKQLKARRSHFKKWKDLLHRWRGFSKRDTLKSSLKLYDQENEILDESSRRDIELLDDLLDQDVVCIDWVEGRVDWGKKRISFMNDVISRVPRSLAIKEEELMTLLDNFPHHIESTRKHRDERKDKERDQNFSETGIRETNNERDLRTHRNRQAREVELRRQAREAEKLRKILQAFEEGTTTLERRLVTLEKMHVLSSEYFDDRPWKPRKRGIESLFEELREELSVAIVKSLDLIERLRISQETGDDMEKLTRERKQLDSKWQELFKTGFNKGVIKKFLPNKGFGFIGEKSRDLPRDVFFHIDNVHGIEAGELVGTPVIFMTELKDKGPSANWVIGDY